MALDHLAAVRAESARCAQLLADADPRATVPSCPGWTTVDLLWHLTDVQFFWATMVRDALTDPRAAQAAKPHRPDGYAELVALHELSVGALVEALENAPDDVRVWTFSPTDRSLQFVLRRVAHELLIHRFDAELAAGGVTGVVDPQLASDGIDEVLTVMYSGYPAWADFTPGPEVGRVAALDSGADWLVRPGAWSGISPGSGRAYADEPALVVLTAEQPVHAEQPSFEVTGSAADLDAWLWNRPGEVRVEGAVDGFLARVRKGVQQGP